VRNSILLVDFTSPSPGRRTRRSDGAHRGRRTRFKPIFLTAAAANDRRGLSSRDRSSGPRISLVFGLASSTALTVMGHPGDLCLLRETTAGEDEGLNRRFRAIASSARGAPSSWARASAHHRAERIASTSSRNSGPPNAVVCGSHPVVFRQFPFTGRPPCGRGAPSLRRAAAFDAGC